MWTTSSTPPSRCGCPDELRVLHVLPRSSPSTIRKGSRTRSASPACGWQPRCISSPATTTWRATSKCVEKVGLRVDQLIFSRPGLQLRRADRRRRSLVSAWWTSVVAPWTCRCLPAAPRHTKGDSLCGQHGDQRHRLCLRHAAAGCGGDQGALWLCPRPPGQQGKTISKCPVSAVARRAARNGRHWRK